MISYEIAKYFENGLISILLILSLICWYKWQGKDAKSIINKNQTYFPLLILFCLILCVLVGFRPMENFGDTANYARRYEIFQKENFNDFDSGEWFFNLLMAYFAKRYELGVFFTFIMFLYVFLAFWGIYRLFKNNTYGGMLFFLGSFSFFAYASNGIRNGLACSLVILGISFLIADCKNKKNFLLFKNWVIGLTFCYLATVIHNSTYLPILCLGVSLFIKNINFSIAFWVLSIFLNLGFSSSIENFFIDLGFDDRLNQYIETADSYAYEGNKSGFRADFLLYSIMPIFLGWYIIVVKKIKNNFTYRMLINTYILSNSFWVMLMNAAFSNRFAYLSWFLYPLVIAYPCLKMNIWQLKQGKMAGLILLAYVGFTFFMDFVH